MFDRFLPVFSAVLFLILASTTFAQRDLNQDQNALFSGSGNCQLCHGAASTANVTGTGEDVSPPSTWRSAMMANAARDPFWQAQVISESMDLPAIKDVVQDKCTNCHMPMGHESARQLGAPHFTLDEGKADGLSMDGVSCTLCHQVEEENFGTVESFSGGYEIASERVTYGPYDNPLIQPMRNISGYTAVYSPHIEQSEHCATCHTLFTPYVDAQGQIAGEFPEQTPYLEWRASDYPAMNKHCQSCHMPALQEAIKISSLPMHSPPRSPYFQHHFVGGNAFMLEVIKTHATDIGATALDEHFDNSIARTRNQLQNNTVQLSGEVALAGGDLTAAIRIENLAGHKFPSGFPSRRAWLHITVRDAQQNSVFETGTWDGEGRIVDHDAGLERHYARITRADQVQIYESVLGNTDDEVTARLLRAAKYLKDNRLPPVGYSDAAAESDTIGFVGGAKWDRDFNSIDGKEHTGGDVLHLDIDVDANAGPYSVDVEMCYQSVKPLFIDNLARYDTPETNRMTDYYDAAGSSVEVIAQLTLNTGVSSIRSLPDRNAIAVLEAYPQPMMLSGGRGMNLLYTLRHPAKQVVIEVYSLLGTQVASWKLGERESGHHDVSLRLHRMRAGSYFVTLMADGERRVLPVTILP